MFVPNVVLSVLARQTWLTTTREEVLGSEFVMTKYWFWSSWMEYVVVTRKEWITVCISKKDVIWEFVLVLSVFHEFAWILLSLKYQTVYLSWLCLLISMMQAIQCLGGNGYVNEYPTGRLLRDAKLFEIGAGTSEIRRMIIGRELFKE